MAEESVLETHSARVNDREVHVRYRSDSKADRIVIQQIFGDHDYSVAHWRHGQLLAQIYDGIVRAGMRVLVVDAGANIGASAAYFRAAYPESVVLAVEPAPDNLELLRMNCEDPHIRIFEGALSCEDGTQFLVDPGIGPFGYRVGETGSTQVPVFSMQHLLGTVDRSKVFPFICKIDIEGGEAALFEKNTEWVDDFPLIVIELHDWLLPFHGTSRSFLKTLGAYDFELVYRNENLFCFNSSFFPRLG